MQRPKILPGHIALEITCADLSALLNGLTMSGTILQNIHYKDDLTVGFTVNRQAYEKILAIAEKQGAAVKKLGAFGIYPMVSRFVTIGIPFVLLYPRTDFLYQRGRECTSTRKLYFRGSC